MNLRDRIGILVSLLRSEGKRKAYVGRAMLLSNRDRTNKGTLDIGDTVPTCRPGREAVSMPRYCQVRSPVSARE